MTAPDAQLDSTTAAEKSATITRDVFLLETEQKIQPVLKGALHRHGFNLRSFDQPSAVLATLEQTTPGMVLLEITMPR